MNPAKVLILNIIYPLVGGGFFYLCLYPFFDAGYMIKFIVYFCVFFAFAIYLSYRLMWLIKRQSKEETNMELIIYLEPMPKVNLIHLLAKASKMLLLLAGCCLILAYGLNQPGQWIITALGGVGFYFCIDPLENIWEEDYKARLAANKET